MQSRTIVKVVTDIQNKDIKIDTAEIRADLGESDVLHHSVRTGEPRPSEVLSLQHGVEPSEGLADPVWRLGEGLHADSNPGELDLEVPRVPDKCSDPARCGRINLETFSCFFVYVFHGHNYGQPDVRL